MYRCLGYLQCTSHFRAARAIVTHVTRPARRDCSTRSTSIASLAGSRLGTYVHSITVNGSCRSTCSPFHFAKPPLTACHFQVWTMKEKAFICFGDCFGARPTAALAFTRHLL